MNPQKFARIAESLRQYRRAELGDFQEELGSRPIDTLYVDPLQENAILNSVLSSNTVFLLGRKGTGKSTIFARAQNALRQRQDILSMYADVKSLYDVVDATEIPMQATEKIDVDIGVYRAHMLRKAFLGKVLAELLKEIDSLCDDMSLWDRWLGKKKHCQNLEKISLVSGRVSRKQALKPKNYLSSNESHAAVNPVSNKNRRRLRQ